MWTSLVEAGALAALLAYATYGIEPLLRKRAMRRIRRREKVFFSTNVNTELTGYRIQRNHSGIIAAGVGLLAAFWLVEDVLLRMLGIFVYVWSAVRHLCALRPHQSQESVWLTQAGAYAFHERQGRTFWKGGRERFVWWSDVDGYRIDGSLLQLYKREDMVLQVEFPVHRLADLHKALQELEVAHLENFDRVWVAQVDEQAFYLMEDEVCSIGWDVLDLYGEELGELGLRPEFGVMRNMPGDRLMEEHARSWLQLNLLDEEGQRAASSVFPLWHSSGSVGYLIGASEQELSDKIGAWIKQVLQETAGMREEEVVS